MSTARPAGGGQEARPIPRSGGRGSDAGGRRGDHRAGAEAGAPERRSRTSPPRNPACASSRAAAVARLRGSPGQERWGRAVSRRRRGRKIASNGRAGPIRGGFLASAGDLRRACRQRMGTRRVGNGLLSLRPTGTAPPIGKPRGRGTIETAPRPTALEPAAAALPDLPTSDLRGRLHRTRRPVRPRVRR